MKLMCGQRYILFDHPNKHLLQQLPLILSKILPCDPQNQLPNLTTPSNLRHFLFRHQDLFQNETRIHVPATGPSSQRVLAPLRLSVLRVPLQSIRLCSF